MFWFELWREYRLSIAEIYSLFPEMEIVYFDEKVLIIDNIDDEKLMNVVSKMWWCIKIIKMQNTEYKIQNNEEIFGNLSDNFTTERKNNYAINFYWKTKVNQKDFLLKAKKYFQKAWFSSRFVNSDFNNIKSYQIIKEKLITSKTDFNIVFTSNTIFVWTTFFVQDIDNYTKRDFGKTRDMIVGMLPPKLAQIMLNLSSWVIIYDPFCGLWTVLLESIISWNTEVYWSDISQEMVKTSIKNIEFTKDEFKNNIKKFEVIELDAKNIALSKIFKLAKIDAIVSEWFLWEIFWKSNIDLDKVKVQRQRLASIYEKFFYWLKSLNFTWNIVISFPFWEIKWKYNYFEEIYDILYKYCKIQDLLPRNIDLKVSKSWSLLYKRPDQTVWREIFKLRIK